MELKQFHIDNVEGDWPVPMWKRHEDNSRDNGWAVVFVDDVAPVCLTKIAMGKMSDSEDEQSVLDHIISAISDPLVDAVFCCGFQGFGATSSPGELADHAPVALKSYITQSRASVLIDLSSTSNASFAKTGLSPFPGVDAAGFILETWDISSEYIAVFSRDPSILGFQCPTLRNMVLKNANATSCEIKVRIGNRDRLYQGYTLTDWLNHVRALNIRASQMSAQQWKDMRKAVYQHCVRIWRESEQNSGKLTSPDWCHHLGVASPQNKSTTDKEFSLALKKLSAAVKKSYPQSQHWPTEEWKSTIDVRGISANVPPYDLPPICALGQFLPDSTDLPTVFQLLRQQAAPLCRKYDIDLVNGTLNPQYWKPPYMWFNASALCEGLIRLLKGLADMINKGEAPNDGVAVEWAVIPTKNHTHKGDPSFTLKIQEWKLGNREAIRLPDPIGEGPDNAYVYLRNAGAVVSYLDDNHSLACEVMAQPNHDVQGRTHWELCLPAASHNTHSTAP